MKKLLLFLCLLFIMSGSNARTKNHIESISLVYNATAGLYPWEDRMLLIQKNENFNYYYLPIDFGYEIGATSLKFNFQHKNRRFNTIEFFLPRYNQESVSISNNTEENVLSTWYSQTFHYFSSKIAFCSNCQLLGNDERKGLFFQISTKSHFNMLDHWNSHPSDCRIDLYQSVGIGTLLRIKTGGNVFIDAGLECDLVDFGFQIWNYESIFYGDTNVFVQPLGTLYFKLGYTYYFGKRNG